MVRWSGLLMTTTPIASARERPRGFRPLLAARTQRALVSAVRAALRTNLASYCCRALLCRLRCWERSCEADGGSADCRRMRTEGRACRADSENHAIESRLV